MGKLNRRPKTSAPSTAPSDAKLALVEKIDSLKLKLAERLAEAKMGLMGIQTGNPQLFFKAMVADVPIRAESDGIKETEQRLAECQFPAASPRPANGVVALPNVCGIWKRS